MPKSKKAAPKQVIDCIMELIKYLPETVKNLPEEILERSFWEKNFKKSGRAHRNSGRENEKERSPDKTKFS